MQKERIKQVYVETIVVSYYIVKIKYINLNEVQNVLQWKVYYLTSFSFLYILNLLFTFFLYIFFILRKNKNDIIQNKKKTYFHKEDKKWKAGQFFIAVSSWRGG